MLCRKTTKAYNTVSLNMLKRVTSVPAGSDVIVDFLSGLSSDSQFWPDDAAVLEAARTLPYYAVLTRRRLRMVLDAIEASMHDPKVGPFADRDRLTIEHVLPQTWGVNWPLPADVDPLEARIERDAASVRVRNLALVTKPLNSSLSNAAWASGNDPSKRDVLSVYNQYLLNKDVISQDEWGEQEIRDRGEVLAQAILKIWPKPE